MKRIERRRRVRRTLFLGWLLITGLVFADPAPGQGEKRTQKSIGATMTLPDGWEWQSKFGDTLSIRLPLEINGRDESATGELFTTPGTFVGTRVDEIRSDAEGNRGKNLKIKDGQKFAKQRNVAVVSYVKERGSKPVRKYQRTHYLWRREGMLFEWREEFPVRGGGKVRSGLAAAQRTMTFTTRPDYIAPDKQRDFVNQRAKFKLPPDWIWSGGPTGKKVRITATQVERLFQARSEMLVRGQRWALIAGLLAGKSGATVDQFVQAVKNQLVSDWTDIKGFEIKDRIPFRGEKSQQMVFTGVNGKVGTKERLFVQYFFFKH